VAAAAAATKMGENSLFSPIHFRRFSRHIPSAIDTIGEKRGCEIDEFEENFANSPSNYEIFEP
jgi:hypothetical protein